MGWFTHFRRTWRPGYSSDVIDPNKAFDFERRVLIIKKVIIIVLLLALLIGSIYFVVSSVTSKNETTAATSNSIISSLTGRDENNVQGASVIPLKISNTVVNATGNQVTEITNPDNVTGHLLVASTSISNSSSQDVSLSSASNNSNNVNDASFALSNNDSSSVNISSIITPLLNKNILNTSNPNQNSSSSDLSCSATGNVMECIALTKSFKTITTFYNSTGKHSGNVEGYVMVKMQNNTWHPYCHPQWTLEMGHSLCRGFGFEKLIQLLKIDISQLKQRITRRLGKNVSLDSENRSQPPVLLVLTTTESSVHSMKANTDQYNCEVGYISCK